MKNILITGAGNRSFIGKNLKEAFCEKYNVFAPSHQELELLDFNKLEEYITKYNIEIVIHAAVHVPTINGEMQEYYDDMRMFLNFEKLSRKLEKVLYFGSGAEYDKEEDIQMVGEESIGNRLPHTEYGLAKYTMNMIARKSNNIYNLRLFGVYGKYELWNIKFISNLCCKAMYNLPLTIRRDCMFDYLYIDDLVRITEWFINNVPMFHDYNVCTGNAISLKHIANSVCNITGKRLDITILNEERNKDYTASNKRLINEMKHIEFTTLENGIQELYKYYMLHKNEIGYETIRASV